MDRDCKAVQETLVEVAGEVAAMAAADRRHVEGCAHCQQVAEAESALGSLLSRAVPPAEPELQRAVIEALAGSRRRRRVLAFLPVAASLFLCCVGVALLGGLPGAGVVGLLPQWSAQGFSSLLAAARDWQLVLGATSSSLSSALPPLVRILALVITLVGLAGVGVTVRRLREGLAWQRDR